MRMVSITAGLKQSVEHSFFVEFCRELLDGLLFTRQGETFIRVDSGNFNVLLDALKLLSSLL